MNQDAVQSDRPSFIRVLRWIARIWSSLAFAVILMFVLGEGLPKPADLSSMRSIMLLSLLATWLGLPVGWRWERLGGSLIVGGMVAFHSFNVLESGHFPRGWVFGFLAAPGVLFLICGWSRHRLIRANRS